MAFQVSPGVLVVEKDFTGIVPAVASTAGAYVGAFEWGPVMEVRLVSSEDTLTSTFGRPNADTFVDFYTCLNFLAYGNNLQVVRVAGAAAKNAVSTGTAVLIKNEIDYEDTAADGQLTVGPWAAKYPGVKGNSLKVVAVDQCTSSVVYDAIEYTDSNFVKDVFLRPGTTKYAEDRTGMDDIADEMHIMIIDAEGLWSGTKGTILETFPNVSKASDAKRADGTSNYYKNVVNNESKYIWWTDHLEPTMGSVASLALTSGGTGYTTGTQALIFTGGGGSGATGTATVDGGGVVTAVALTSGGSGYTSAPVVSVATGTGLAVTVTMTGLQPADHTADLGSLLTSITTTNKFELILNDGAGLGHEVTLIGGVSDEDGVVDADRQFGWDIFTNDDLYDISLLPVGGASMVLAKYVIDNVAEVRKDCVVFVSPLLTDVKGNVGVEAADVVVSRNALGSSSYAVMDSGWKYQYDKYNDVFRWIPLNGDMAGLCARTDLIADPWFSPGGFNRGRIKNVVKLAFSPNKAERDVLYINGVNPVTTFPGDGTVLFGDKTLQAKPSAFDRINVRRLFIILEKAIAKAAKYQLFEFNDEFTRAMFRNMVEPFLRDVQGRRGLTDFKVVCDETNNTGEIIDRNEFVADIYLKPARSINFITLNFIATKTGVSFSEVGA